MNCSMKLALILGLGFPILVSCDSNPKEWNPVQQPQPQQAKPVRHDGWWKVHPRPVYASLEKVGTYQQWFDVYKLTEGTFAIYELNQFEEVISYLVLGTEKGILIDTGTGIGDIKKVTEALTDLPVSVVITHAHYDHVGGNHLFDGFAALDNKAGLAELKKGLGNASLQQYITDDYLWKPLPKEFKPEEYVIPSQQPTSLLHDGDVIDLGERKIEIIHTPGHTDDSICLLDRQQRILFSGDHFYPGPLHFESDYVNLDDFLSSNKKLVAMIGDYDHVCSGHNDPWVKSEVISRVSEAFDTIFSNKGDFSEEHGLRRYPFGEFSLSLTAEQVERHAAKEKNGVRKNGVRHN